MIPPIRQLEAVADHAVILVHQKDPAVVSGCDGVHLGVQGRVPFRASEIARPRKPGGKDQAPVLDLILPAFQKRLTIDIGNDGAFQHDGDKPHKKKADDEKDLQPDRRKPEFYAVSEGHAGRLLSSASVSVLFPFLLLLPLLFCFRFCFCFRF